MSFNKKKAWCVLRAFWGSAGLRGALAFPVRQENPFGTFGCLGFDRMVRRVLTASLCGVAALIAPGRAVVTAVPRRRPVLKPGGKEEARPPPRRLTSGGDCFDTNNGATDSDGDGCSVYTNNPNWCGGFDDGDFSSDDMCCTCDGGSENASPPTAPTHTPAPTVPCFDTNNGATDPFGDGCEYYDSNPLLACGGGYDDGDFSSDDMCCACGGGSGPTTAPTTAPTSTAPTHSASPTGSHAPTVTPIQVGGFLPFRQACDGLAEGGHLNVEVINDITLGQEIDLQGDRSLRVFCDAAASRKALSGGGATRLFGVAYGAELEVENLELRDGWAQDDGGWEDGKMRGGVFLVIEATLVLVGCLVRGADASRVRGARGVW